MARIRLRGLTLDTTSSFSLRWSGSVALPALFAAGDAPVSLTGFAINSPPFNDFAELSVSGGDLSDSLETLGTLLFTASDGMTMLLAMLPRADRTAPYRWGPTDSRTMGGGVDEARHVPSGGWTRTRLTPTPQNAVYLSDRTVTLDAAGEFVSATAWSAPSLLYGRVRSGTRVLQTDAVYRLTATRLAAPPGGTDEQDHVPDGWTREAPFPTPTQSVVVSRRSLNFRARKFVSASAWGTPTTFNSQVSGSRAVFSDLVYIHSRTAPEQPEQPTVTSTLDEMRAWGAAVAALSDHTFSLEIFDGQDDGDLALPRIPALEYQINQEMEDVEFPVATGGVLPHSYVLMGYPTGTSYDEATRTLSGMPTSVGTYTLTYRATDAEGVTAEARVTFVVTPDLRPIFKVEIDWDGDGRFRNDESDVTAAIESLPTCRRGRDFAQRFFGRTGAGILEMRLRDNDHLYDRFNRESILFGKVVGGRAVRLSVLSRGEYEQEWGGLLDDPKPEERSGHRLMRLRALGALSLLQRNTVDVALTDEITVANAAGAVFDSAELPERWRGTLAGPTVIPRWLVDRLQGLRALQDLEQTELGFIHEGRDGRINLDAHAARRREGTPVKVFTGPGVTPATTETPVTSLAWSDPIADIVSRVVIPVRTYSTDAAAAELWSLPSPLEIPAGESITLVARVQQNLGVGGIAGVVTWETPDDYTANVLADGSGANRTDDLNIAVEASGLAATVTVTNAGAVDLWLTRLVLEGTAVRVATDYDAEYVDDEALAAYDDQEYRVRSRFVAAGQASRYATRIFLTFGRAASRGTLTYDQDPTSARPNLSDLVVMRLPEGPRLYYVEQVRNSWHPGARHEVGLIISEVGTIPDAIAPEIAIHDVPDGHTGTEVALSADVVGGAYDGDAEYAWTVSRGTLDDATAASPTWTRPTDHGEVRIGLTVTVRGTGTITKDGTSAMESDTVTASVTQRPVAVAPAVSIGAVVSGREGTAARLTAELSGGAYDGDAEYAWTVSGGTLDDATAASPTWTRPQVDADEDVTIGLAVTVRGTGADHRAGSSDSRTVSLATTVLDRPAVTAPMVSIVDPPVGIEGTDVRLGATITGGRYDTIEYLWSLDSGHGTLDNATALSPLWTRPFISPTQQLPSVIFLTVTVRGDGTDTEAGSSETVRVNATATTRSEGSTIPDPPTIPAAVAPAVSITNVPSGREGTAARLTAELSGGAYDGDAEYAWTVSRGTLDDATVASPTWTRPQVDADEDVTIGLAVTVRGAGSRARAGTQAIGQASRTATVTDTPADPGDLPDAAAPAVSITNVPSGREGTTARLSAALTGGTYDTLTRAWTVERGTLDDATAVSPTWTRPQVDASTAYDVTLEVTARGDGTAAASGSSDTARATVAATVTDTPGDPDDPDPETDWTEVAGTRSTEWGAWTATSTYRGSCASRERLYTRTGTTTWTERRTNAEGQTETRNRSEAASGSEYHSAPEADVCTERRGSSSTNCGAWVAGGYSGSCSSRTRSYSRQCTESWTITRTCTCSGTTTRPGSRSYTQTESRSAPEPRTCGGWLRVSSNTSCTPWVRTGCTTIGAALVCTYTRTCTTRTVRLRVCNCPPVSEFDIQVVSRVETDTRSS